MARQLLFSLLSPGWLPNRPPIGYLNDKTTNTIVCDPDRFLIVRRLWELALTGAYSPPQLCDIARDELGLRTYKRKRLGGKPVARSAIYKILMHPYYAGLIPFDGNLYPGRHEAMVTLDEFDRVQALFRRASAPRPICRSFTYTGLMRCGECGAAITAEEKINRFGSKYVYYHCTKRRAGVRCSQRSVELRALEAQICDFLRRIALSESELLWALGELRKQDEEMKEKEPVEGKALAQALSETRKQLDTLTSLRLRDLLTDSEFLHRRSALQLEAQRLIQNIEKLEQSATERFEPLVDVISFRNKAISWFLSGNQAIKRLVVDSIGSNLTLRDKLLSIEAKKPFFISDKYLGLPDLSALRDDVRTLAHDSECIKLRSNLRELRRLVKDQESSDAAPETT